MTKHLEFKVTLPDGEPQIVGITQLPRLIDLGKRQREIVKILNWLEGTEDGDRALLTKIEPVEVE